MHSVNGGEYDSLTCPECGCPSVSAWFTHPRQDRYFTWLVCEKCDFEAHAAHLQDCPAGYREDRRNKELELLDEAVLAGHKTRDTQLRRQKED
jgi:hypothetical protein